MLTDVQEDSKGVNDKKSKGLCLVLFDKQYIFFHFIPCKYNRNNDAFTVQFYPTDCHSYLPSISAWYMSFITVRKEVAAR